MALTFGSAAEGGDSSRHEDSGSTLQAGVPKTRVVRVFGVEAGVPKTRVVRVFGVEAGVPKTRVVRVLGWRRGLRRILIQSIEEVNEPFKTVVAQRRDIRLLCAQLPKTMHRNGSDNPVLLVASGLHWIQPGGAARRQAARGSADNEKQRYCGHKDKRISGAH